MPKHPGTLPQEYVRQVGGHSWASVVRGAGELDEGASRRCARRRWLLQAVAIGAWMSPAAAWGQAAATLPEVTVTAPRPTPAPVRRATHTATPARSSRSARVSTPAPSSPSPPAPAAQLPAFQVVATTPVAGLGLDRDKVAAMVQTVPAEDFSRVYSPNVTQTLDQRIPGVFTSDAQGNEFTSDLRYRGFTASPLQGTPQGLAVYMQGVRVNEAFGDTVNWDLIPTVAIGRADVWTNNPAFGLNALGGAISFQMKDGFTYRGTEFDASGGSYGRVGGSLQYGVGMGNGPSTSRRRASKTMAGATNRRRGSLASMAISAGRAPMRKSIWSRAPPTISSA